MVQNTDYGRCISSSQETLIHPLLTDPTLRIAAVEAEADCNRCLLRIQSIHSTLHSMVHESFLHHWILNTNPLINAYASISIPLKLCWGAVCAWKVPNEGGAPPPPPLLPYPPPNPFPVLIGAPPPPNPFCCCPNPFDLQHIQSITVPSNIQHFFTAVPETEQ